MRITRLARIGALLLYGCSGSSSTEPGLPDITGTYQLKSFGGRSLPARWLPSGLPPDFFTVSAEESHIESGQITFTQTGTANTYNFTKIDTFDDYRVSPITRIRTTLIQTGAVTVTFVATKGHPVLTYSITTGPDANTVAEGEAAEGTIRFRAYFYLP